MTLTEMDLVRGAITQAIAEGLCISDLWFCAEYAEDALDFNEAVNLLAGTQPLPAITSPTTA